MRINLGIFKKRLDVIVIIATGLYFSYQFTNGSDVSNISIEIITERYQRDSLEDHLAIDLRLANEGNGSIFLREIKAKISSVDSSANSYVDTIINEFIGTVELKEIDTLNETRLIEGWELEKNEKYRFAVDETVQYATYLKVPKNSVCAIEIVVLAERNRFFIPDYRQWRASSISLPVKGMNNSSPN